MSEPQTELVVVNVLGEKGLNWILQDLTEETIPPKIAGFPKSQVVFERRNVKTGKALANIPVWLLEDRNW